MKKNYIKMNDKKYLSLGNVINVIKEVSNNSSAMQTEIFCSIFGCNNVNTTTINNYCIGIRAIGIEYRNIFETSYNNDTLQNNIFSIISILDNKIYTQKENIMDIINQNDKLNIVIDKLLTIASNDEYIEESNIFKKNNNYETIKELLYYAIIKNKQPLYSQDINIKYDKKELNEYMNLKLYWGQSYITSLINLSNKNNMYACAELASLYFDGTVDGNIDYEKSYYYYLKAANKNHPKACWMISNLMLSNRIKMDEEIMWKYLNKSIELGSAAGYNTLGLCYLKGINPKKEIDIEKAKYYFELASDLGYVFAFNNLGKLYEKDNIEESIKYYKISADMNNSWALNKMGEYYRKNNDLKTAYLYYSASIKCPINERCKFAYYNLANYYYKNGFKELNISKDEKICKEYLSM